MLGLLILFVVFAILFGLFPGLSGAKDDLENKPSSNDDDGSTTEAGPDVVDRSQYAEQVGSTTFKSDVSVNQPIGPSAEWSVDDAEALEERFYEQAASELASKDVQKGIMALAFSESDGNEKRTDALYLRYRVAQLLAAHGEELSQWNAEPKNDPVQFDEALVDELVDRNNHIDEDEASASAYQAQGATEISSPSTLTHGNDDPVAEASDSLLWLNVIAVGIIGIIFLAAYLGGKDVDVDNPSSTVSLIEAERSAILDALEAGNFNSPQGARSLYSDFVSSHPGVHFSDLRTRMLDILDNRIDAFFDNWKSTSEATSDQWTEMVDATTFAKELERTNTTYEARALYAKARVALNQGNVSEARTLIHESSLIWPRWALAANGLAVIAERSGELEDAVDRYAEAADLDPNWLFPNINQVRLLFELERYSELVPIAQRIIDNDPSGSNSGSGAIEDSFEKTYVPAPSSNHLAYLHYVLSQAYEQQSRYIDAIREAEEALSFDPERAEGFDPDQLRNAIVIWRRANSPIEIESLFYVLNPTSSSESWIMAYYPPTYTVRLAVRNTNLSGNAIKYIRILVQPVNRVGDPAYTSDSGGNTYSARWLVVEGPVWPSSQASLYEWRNPWSSVASTFVARAREPDCIRIEQVTVELMDGRTSSWGDNLNDLYGPRFKNCIVN